MKELHTDVGKIWNVLVMSDEFVTFTKHKSKCFILSKELINIMFTDGLLVIKYLIRMFYKKEY